MQTLAKLEIGANRFGAQGAQYLADALKSNTVIFILL